jgi:hypothetical protein
MMSKSERHIPELHIKETEGPAVVVQDRHIRPVGQAVMLKWSRGALIWHRAAAVEVRQGENLERLPITNSTRRTIIAIVLSGLLLLAVAWGMLRSRNLS